MNTIVEHIPYFVGAFMGIVICHKLELPTALLILAITLISLLVAAAIKKIFL